MPMEVFYDRDQIRFTPDAEATITSFLAGSPMVTGWTAVQICLNYNSGRDRASFSFYDQDNLNRWPEGRDEHCVTFIDLKLEAKMVDNDLGHTYEIVTRHEVFEEDDDSYDGAFG